MASSSPVQAAEKSWLARAFFSLALSVLARAAKVVGDVGEVVVGELLGDGGGDHWRVAAWNEGGQSDIDVGLHDRSGDRGELATESVDG